MFKQVLGQAAAMYLTRAAVVTINTIFKNDAGEELLDLTSTADPNKVGDVTEVAKGAGQTFEMMKEASVDLTAEDGIFGEGDEGVVLRKAFAELFGEKLPEAVRTVFGKPMD